MGYSFVKITSFYRDFLEDYYKSYPYITRENYHTQFRHLMDQGYGYSDFFSLHMKNLGNEAYEIIHNVYPLQGAWAEEKGIKKSGNELIIAQLKEYKAEVVLFQDSTHFSRSFIRAIREQVPSIRIMIGMCCSPITRDHFDVYAEFDIILGCSPKFTGILKDNGIKSHLFYHSIERSLCEKVSKPEYKNLEDVVFIGSFIGSRDYHDERLAFIEQLLKAGIDIDIISSLRMDSSVVRFLKRILYGTSRLLKGTGLKNLAFSLPLIRKFSVLNEAPKQLRFSDTFKQHTEYVSLFGLKMLERIAKSKIGLNIHAGVSGEFAANVRMFEVTGAGSCLLTDDKRNIRDLFHPGNEIVTYGSLEECVEKIRWLLEHPAECEEISRKGRSRTLRDHTVENRVKQLDHIISGYL